VVTCLSLVSLHTSNVRLVIGRGLSVFGGCSLAAAYLCSVGELGSPFVWRDDTSPVRCWYSYLGRVVSGGAVLSLAVVTAAVQARSRRPDLNRAGACL